MAARVDELCDAAVDVIEAAASVNTTLGTTVVTVTADDDPDIDADTLAAGQMVVCVFSDGYADGGPASRGVDITDYRIHVLVVEKYPDAGRVTTDWRRLRTEWVDTSVVRALGDARDSLDGAYALSLDDVVFDVEELVEQQLFWCRVSVTLRDEREV